MGEKVSLYCFQFDEVTGKLTRTEIKNYSRRDISQYTGRFSYVFRDSSTGTRKEVKNENIGLYKNHRVYSFDSDPKPVIEIITKTIDDKLDKSILETKKLAFAKEMTKNLQLSED